MRPYFTSFALAASLSCATLAQDTTIPQGLFATEGDTQDGVFTVDLGSVRQQTVYDSSHFAGLPPSIPIQRLYFRCNGGVSSFQTIYDPVTVDLAYAAAGVNSTTLSTGAQWAQNKADGDNPEFVGSVDVMTASSATPGEWYCVIDLLTPFVYDNTSGTPLVLDISIPASSLQQPFSFARPADAVSGSGQGFRSATSNSSTSSGPSTISDSAFVLGLDMPNWADWSDYGQGCGEARASAYQVSLGSVQAGSAGQGLRFAPNVMGGYDVSTTTGGWHTPTGTNLGNPAEVQRTLPFSFAHPGGSTQQVVVASSGRVWLDAASGTWLFPDDVPGASLRGPATIAAFAKGQAAQGGTIYEDVLANGDVVITWEAMTYNALLVIEGPFDSQCVLSPDGTFEIRWQTLSNNFSRTFLGYTAGNGAIDPGSIDLLASTPFSTQADGRAPTLVPQSRPVMGTALSMDVGEIPGNAIYCACVFSAQRQSMDLTSRGMPGCFQYTTIADVSGFFPSGPVGSAFLANIPTIPSWVGQRVYAQAVVWAPNRNPLGIVTTHGVELRVNLY